MWNRAFSDDTDQPADGSPGSEPEYTFDGFKVDFSEKVMLIPWEGHGKKEPRERGDR